MTSDMDLPHVSAALDARLSGRVGCEMSDKPHIYPKDGWWVVSIRGRLVTWGRLTFPEACDIARSFWRVLRRPSIPTLAEMNEYISRNARMGQTNHG